MKHNIFWLLTLVGVASGIMLNACTDYTEDIQAPRSSFQPNPGFSSGVNNQLPPELQKPNDGEFSEEKMLVNIGLNVIFHNVDDFYVETRRLKRDVNERCTKLKSGVNDAHHLNRVQEQWKRTMLAYHRLDAAPIGPLSANKSELGNSIYSWPFVSYCNVDLEVARSAKGKVSEVETLAPNRKGLAALEYLLFSAATDTVCPKSAINKDAVEWLAKNDLDKQLDRCLVESRFSDDIEKRAKILFTQWDPAQNNYTKKMIDGSEFASTKKAINALTDALFSIEAIKDAKLGQPLGLIKGCADASGLCPLDTEHILSGLGLESIDAQVSVFKDVFFGSSDTNIKAFGFDDYLISKGHPAVVDDFVIELKNVATSVNKTQSAGVLKDLIASTDKSTCSVEMQVSPQPVCQLFMDIRLLTNLIKTELLTVLALEAPAAFQGDND